jgi:hypothetical protein
VYQEHNTDELWHAKGKGLNWSDYECVDPDEWIRCSTSCLKCDSSGRLHLSYLRIVQEGVFISYSLYYACRDNSGWHEELVDNHTSEYHSLSLDPSGMPHIAYFGSEPPNAQELKYAYKDATGWHIEYVKEDFGYTISPNHIVSLAVDSSCRPHISCDSNFGLLYGTRVGHCNSLAYAGTSD